MRTTCGQCGAVLPDVDGPVHDYLPSSPACFAAYGAVLARCYEDPRLVRVRQLAVDAWSVQHPGAPGRVADQALALHLMTLHLSCEEGVDPARGPALHASMVTGRPDYRRLEPPRHRGAVTVADLVPAGGADAERLHSWAGAAWQAWAVHHGTVRGCVECWRQALPAATGAARRPRWVRP